MTKVEVCETHASEKLWRDCWNCDKDGFEDHDCGEDTCCCLNPQPNVRCDVCFGKGGWYQCFTCAPWED